MNRNIESRYLGTLSYSAGLRRQAEARLRLESNEVAAEVLGLEHEPVVTLGVRGRFDADVVVSPAELDLKGFELRQTERGGQATLHSPGQLVIYPCVNLRAFNLGARTFVDLVQATTAEWIRAMGIAVHADSLEPGLFIDKSKVAAFGFKISRGLTSHGIAINVANDLGHFDLIRTCGVRGQKVTRLRDHGVNLSAEALFLSWAKAFKVKLSNSVESHLTDIDASN